MFVFQIQNSFNLRKFMEYSALGHASKMRLDLHKTKRQEQGGTLLLCDLCQVTPLIRSLISDVPRGAGSDALWSLSLLKEKCYNQFSPGLRPTSSHSLDNPFYKLIIHSISIGGRQRHWAFTWRRLEWCPFRQPLDLSNQPKRSGGLGAAESPWPPMSQDMS